MSQAVVLWIFGSAFTVILSLLSLVFYQHTKSDDDLKTFVEGHVIKFTETVKQDAVLLSEVRRLNLDLPRMHEDTRMYVTRELTHARELAEAARFADTAIINGLNKEVIALREKVIAQSEELRLNTVTITGLNSEVIRLRDKVAEQSEQLRVIAALKNKLREES